MLFICKLHIIQSWHLQKQRPKNGRVGYSFPLLHFRLSPPLRIVNYVYISVLGVVLHSLKLCYFFKNYFFPSHLLIDSFYYYFSSSLLFSSGMFNLLLILSSIFFTQILRLEKFNLILKGIFHLTI